MKKLLLATATFLTLTTTVYANTNDGFNLFGDDDERTTERSVKSSRHSRSRNDDSSNVSSGSKMVASFYGHGERLANHTASGAVFNPNAHTAAHKTLPFGTPLRVCHRGCVTVVINDRGPFVRGRHLDLSYGAARAIGMGSTSRVTVERLN